MDANEFAVHADPVWRDRADFIINAALPESSTDKKFEQLWTRQIADDQFEVCCIPFFLYDIALGDIVEASARSEPPYLLNSVVRASGRYAFRIWFGESKTPVEPITGELTSLGVLMEWSSTNLIAVDVIDAERAQIVADYLADKEERGELIYETARSA